MTADYTGTILPQGTNANDNTQGNDLETFSNIGTIVPLDDILTEGEIAARDFTARIAARGD